tara:strand:- start:122 stop:811 length:690 start_codon:yes stop_codon:yes gene_type:complete
MKKIILIATFLFLSNNVFSQYVAFYKFKTDQPEMVVSILQEMINSDWGKQINGTCNLFQVLFAGNDDSTHIVNFDFMTEKDLNSFLISASGSKMTQLLQSKMRSVTDLKSTYVGTPIWYEGDWSPDQVFMIYDLDVSDPSTYVKEFTSMSNKLKKKQKIVGSYGVGMPILGQSEDFSHFIWMGAPSVEASLKQTKKIYADPLFAEFNRNVSSIRKIKGTWMMVRLAKFK